MLIKVLAFPNRVVNGQTCLGSNPKTNLKPKLCPKHPKVKLDLIILAMFLSYFDYGFVHLRQKVRLRPELSPKFLSTLGPNPAQVRPDLQLCFQKHTATLQSSFFMLSSLAHFSARFLDCVLCLFIGKKKDHRCAQNLCFHSGYEDVEKRNRIWFVICYIFSS